MKKTAEKIQKLDSILREKNAPVLKYFNPGLFTDDIITFFQKKGINPSSSLISLYEWHNGIDFISANVIQTIIEIMPMGIFYTLEYMNKTFEDLIRWKYMEDPKGFLPLFGSGEDDIYLLKNETGEIFYLSPSVQVYGELQFKSIDAMLDCVIECYEENVFRIDRIIGLDTKYSEYENIKRKYK